jgi:hypothetical protein
MSFASVLGGLADPKTTLLFIAPTVFPKAFVVFSSKD